VTFLAALDKDRPHFGFEELALVARQFSGRRRSACKLGGFVGDRGG
jgi:hypothetical protein